MRCEGLQKVLSLSKYSRKLSICGYGSVGLSTMSYLRHNSSLASTIALLVRSDFETKLAKYTGANYSVGVGNATDAMEIFLEAIGLNKGDEIIISSHTMLATASAIKFAGGIPVPVDIGEDNLISSESIEDAITSNTVGIMPTQLNGRICEMDTISKIAKKNNINLTKKIHLMDVT